ncbi:MAG TPA: F0F1 ATP synthase subunit A [Geobacteraceae bacterium]|nr:F0F1 ATP synthase subunit A [Geobacteraceae bacterium]
MEVIHPFLFLQFFRELLSPLLKYTTEAGIDAILYTWLVMAILIILGLVVRSSINRIPGKLQNFMELFIGAIEKLITDNMGEKGKPFFPLIATLAFFILTSNLIGLIPGFYPPTANLNTTIACAIIVFITTHIVGIRQHGFSYVKHFLGPVWWLAPFMFFVEIIGHLSRPLSLSFRLFGNMNGHELILIIFFTLAPFLVPLPMMLMGVLIAFLQSFVFMLLATIYIQGSLEEAH